MILATRIREIIYSSVGARDLRSDVIEQKKSTSLSSIKFTAQVDCKAAIDACLNRILVGKGRPVPHASTREY